MKFVPCLCSVVFLSVGVLSSNEEVDTNTALKLYAKFIESPPINIGDRYPEWPKQVDESNFVIDREFVAGRTIVKLATNGCILLLADEKFGIVPASPWFGQVPRKICQFKSGDVTSVIGYAFFHQSGFGRYTSTLFHIRIPSGSKPTYDVYPLSVFIARDNVGEFRFIPADSTIEYSTEKFKWRLFKVNQHDSTSPLSLLPRTKKNPYTTTRFKILLDVHDALAAE